MSAGTAAGNGNNTVVVGSKTDGPLQIPFAGTRTASVNARGDGYRASGIKQTATITLADVDPVDNKIHVRMAVAPVIEDGGHPPVQQAYFFVEIRNVTPGKERVMFHTFNFANQPGVPWQTLGGYQYTGWQGIDVAPGNGFLDVGDQIEVEVIAAGCSQSGHSGEIYVDAVGSFIQGLSISASGPTTTRPEDEITYTYTYANNSGLASTGTKITLVMPQTGNSLDTTYVAGSASGASCTGNGTAATPLVCDVGTVNDKASGSFTVKVKVPAGASTTAPQDTVNNGNYRIESDGASAFLGPLVQTQVVSKATSVTDLSVTLTDGGSSVAPNAQVSYTAVVTNNGADALTSAPVTQTASGLSNITWTCTGATCAAPSGTGLINSTVDLAAGASVTYVITGTADASGTTSTAVTVAAPSGLTDTNTANNTAADTNTIGQLYTVTVSKGGTGSGSVQSVPPGLGCNTSCTTQSAQVADGSQVILTPVTAPGSVFTGWSGACTNTTGTCTITVNGANAAATANFGPAPVTVTASAGPNGTVSPSGPTTVAPGTPVTFALTPANGYAPLIGGTCAGTLSGNSYTIASATSDCSLNVSFTNDTAQLTTTVTGGNGTASPLGSTTVAVGSQQTIILAPASGYAPRIATGANACAGTLNGNVFTTTVASSCTVNVSFVLAAPTAAPIPTLSEWGLIILSALMGLFMVGMHRRQMR